MKVARALDFIRERGVVLVSASGPAPKLVDFIAGELVKGSWWGHRKGREIFAVLEAVTDSPDVLVCRLVEGKLTLVHRRAWPALARLSRRFSKARLAQVTQEHTTSGKHVNKMTPFPKWVPPEVLKEAAGLSEAQAGAVLGPWADKPVPKKAR